MSGIAYIVAAHQRSKSNAAIAAVEDAGPLSAWYTPSRHERFHKDLDDADYKFNDRLRELQPCGACISNVVFWSTASPGEVPGCHDPHCLNNFIRHPWLGAGKVTKIHIDGMSWPLPLTVNYKLIVLLRDYEEVRQSWAAMGRTDMRPPGEYYEMVTGFYHNAPVPQRDKMLIWSRDLLGECSLTNYQTWLRVQAAGWPVDPAVAAATAKPEMNRFRREVLTEGIQHVTMRRTQ